MYVKTDAEQLNLIHHNSTSYQLQISVLCVDNIDQKRFRAEEDTEIGTVFGESKPAYPYRSVFTSWVRQNLRHVKRLVDGRESI